MNILYKSYSTPKDGLSAAEMEDAMWPNGTQSLYDAATFHAAIADGATQGSHSGPWAESLCKAYVSIGNSFPKQDHDIMLAPWLLDLWHSAKQTFNDWEKSYLERRAQNGRQLAWFEEAVIQTGAFSTLLGITLDNTENGVILHTLAIGDSCLFIIRHGRLFRSFPYTRAKQFQTSPYLVATDAQKNTRIRSASSLYRETLADGDEILLCTDALSCWILKQLELGQDPSPTLQSISQEGPKAFEEFLKVKRSNHEIRNDDVTFVHMQLQVKHRGP